ncbi:MAG: hypothetical protein Q4A71_03260 [Actinomycetaceae bacterium]|nr:hypothetical protein [Actinomycetaceae bacterium]
MSINMLGGMPLGKSPVPTGTEVASFRTYAEAQAAVDALAEDDYPVHELTIVGTDLIMVERVTGKATASKVFLRGLLNGLWWGIMLSMLYMVANRQGGTSLSIFITLSCALVFGLVNVAFHAILGKKNRQDFTSVTSLAASRYCVFASADAISARRALAGAPGNLLKEEAPRPQANAFGAGADEEPRYGVRLTPAQRAARERDLESGRASADTGDFSEDESR